MEKKTKASLTEAEEELIEELVGGEYDESSENVLLKAHDSPVCLMVSESNSLFRVSISVKRIVYITYLKDWFSIELTASELRIFLHDLKNGKKSKHGDGNIFFEEKIAIEANESPVLFREIKLLYRAFVFYKVVPVTISRNIMSQVVEFEKIFG